MIFGGPIKFLLYCDVNVDLMMGNPRRSLGRCRMRSGLSIHMANFIGGGDAWGLRKKVTVAHAHKAREDENC